MIYQIRANLYFSRRDIPDELMQKLIQLWKHAIVVNPGTPDQECSEIEIIENHHDEDPNGPCAQLSYRDNCPPPP